MFKYDRNKFVKAYNDIESFGDVQEVADYLGITRNQAKDRAYLLRKAGYNVIFRSDQTDINEAKFIEAYNNPETFPTIISIADYLNCSERSVRRYVNKLRERGHDLIDRSNLYKNDPDIIKSAIKEKRRAQLFQDKNRETNKILRENYRTVNTIEEINLNLQSLLDTHKLSRSKPKLDSGFSDSGAVGVIQLSDLHLNELVELDNNSYDFNVAAKRLKLHVDKSVSHLKSLGVTNVLIALSGDTINSDRRLSEVMMMATNRSKAIFCAVDLLQQVIVDISSNFNLVTVASVCGNESRLNKDIEWIDNIVTENFDYTIFNMLAYLFKDCKDIVFARNENPFEVIITLAGQNLLLVHGHTVIKHKNPETSIAKLKARFAGKGEFVDYVIFGHVHNTMISDFYARSGSTVGANAYSERALNVESKASQNYYVFWDNGNIDAFKNDLQNVGDVEGYEIQDTLESYNSKSAMKADGSGNYRIEITTI